MTTRHRNSKSHKKSVRNRVQKGGAKLEKSNKTLQLKDIPDIQDLDGATYTQDLMNRHSYKIHVFEPNMTYDDFEKEVDYEIKKDSGSTTTFIEKINDTDTILKNNKNTLEIKKKNITGFTLLWNFKDSKIKIETPIKISVPFYDNPVDITLDSSTKCILFNSSNI